jgi:polyphosphate kinase 2 (PPK2 family)
MFRETSTQRAPWTVVAGEHKWYARVAVCEAIVKRLKSAR